MTAVSGRSKGIALALGAGAFRGLAHLGVLQTFQTCGVPVASIAGSSIGAVMGALYAAGLDLPTLGHLAGQLNIRQLLDAAGRQPSLFAGKKVEELLRLFLGKRTLEHLPLPVGITATDLVSGTEVFLTRGDVVQAVMASIAVPGVFPPVRREDMVLADGGLLARIPVRGARKMEGFPVVAVSLEPPVQGKNLKSASDIIFRSLDLLQMEVQAARCPEADLTITPAVSGMPATSLARSAECIRAGARAARASLPVIWAILRGRAFPSGQEDAESW